MLKKFASRVLLIPATTLIAACALLITTSHAQGDGKPATSITTQPAARGVVINIPRLTGPPQLADFLDMKPGSGVAREMSKVEGFIQLDPSEGAPAQQKTEVYIGYDAKNFYAAWICFDNEPKKIRARMTRRENIGPEHDEVQLYLDTFNDKRRSFGFMANPVGIQFDYIWTDNNGYDASFDTVWDSDGKVTEQGYVLLMSIPFKSLRFPSSPQQTWGILFQRVIPHNNDNSFYPRLTRKIQGRLTQEGLLTGLNNISPGRNIQLVPYGIAGAFRVLDNRDPNRPFFTANHLGADAGLDAKMILKDSLVLDMTFNPDFRQVESDEPQNTVNQRFEVFFPEKRPFFQENTNFFQTPIDLYFTRRISDPQVGVRLTGKLDKYGIGLLAMDDQSPGRIVPDDDPNRRKRAYFTIARLTRDIGEQSHIGVIYADREFSADPNTRCDDLDLGSDVKCLGRYNRVGGIDTRLKFGDNWLAEAQAVVSSTKYADGTYDAGPAFQGYAKYDSRPVFFDSLFISNAEGFVTGTGFFRRPGIYRESQFFQYRWYPENKITRIAPQLFHIGLWGHNGDRLEYLHEPGLSVILKANTDFTIFRGFTHEALTPADFDTLPQLTDYNKGYWGIVVNNTYLKWLSLFANFVTAKTINFDPPSGTAPFLANEQSLNLTATVRPWNPLTIDNTYILERLTARTADAGIINNHVIRSRWNYQYNKKLSFRTIFQYDTLLTNPLFSSLEQHKKFNADFLVTYLVHPGTAFYAGYNSNLQNLDPAAISNHTGLVRTRSSFINDGRILFVKVSYLFRF
ncbi:MAG: carbohydrate binding family 9 domain-containing protein [Acidobacteriales bacterium]|nr:carbohydrate binding family 9 domain-containing protein [Terriglobales bacterium]